MLAMAKFIPVASGTCAASKLQVNLTFVNGLDVWCW